MTEIKIKHDRPLVEELLARYEDVIGEDFPGYRNHVYRATTYAMHFLEYNSEVNHLSKQLLFITTSGCGQIVNWLILNHPKRSL